VSLPLIDALRVCQIHSQALQSALVAAALPVSTLALSEASIERVRALDQAVLRYLKLQDTVGEHVLKSFLVDVLHEPLELAAMLDVINRLEKLNYLDANEWLATRRLRNQLTHDYPEDHERQAASLNDNPACFSTIRLVLERIQLKLQALSL